MRKAQLRVFLIVAFIIIGDRPSVTTTLAVPSERRSATLMYNFSYRVDQDHIWEHCEDLPTVIDDEAFVGITICSNAPLSAAIAGAIADPTAIVRYAAEFRSLPPNRVLIMRHGNCITPEGKWSAVQLWYIPAEAELPPHEEVIRASDVSIDPHPNSLRNLPQRDEEFQRKLEELPGVLLRSQDATGVVVGFYFVRPHPTLLKRLDEATHFLKQRVGAEDRYVVLTLPWSGERDSAAPEPAIPDVYTITIRPTANPLRGGRARGDCAIGL